MIVRTEQPGDYPAIREIHRAAFATHPYSRQTEHLIVEALRAAGALTVSLVAERDGRLVGHIAFSAAPIGGAECGWYILGPIGVLPAFQRQGIGKRLIAEGLQALRALGGRGCVLVGDPAYYEPLGFGNLPGLTMTGVPPRNLLGLPLAEPAPAGEVSHHSAFLAQE